MKGRSTKHRKRKAKLGRPSLGAEARKRIVTLKVTKAEYAAVRAAVRNRGRATTISGWFRDHGLAPLGLGALRKTSPRNRSSCGT